jgi:hypothetical protein
VTTAASYTAVQLAALPQTTATVKVGGKQVTDTGVLLETLVTNAGPAYPASLLNTKNELLRVTVTVRRFVPRVSRLTVGIATTPATDTNPAAGSPVEVIVGRHHVTLSAALLARLPAQTLHVSFLGPSGTQTHTEVGPALLTVLAAARIWPTLNSWVAAVGLDNYVATVTPAEHLAGGRPLQLSLNEDGVALAQPRLVTDGDVHGGRYVSGVVDIYVGTGPAR